MKSNVSNSSRVPFQEKLAIELKSGSQHSYGTVRVFPHEFTSATIIMIHTLLQNLFYESFTLNLVSTQQCLSLFTIRRIFVVWNRCGKQTYIVRKF